MGGRKTTHFKVKNIKLPLWHLEIHMLFWFGGFIKMMDVKKKGLRQCCLVSVIGKRVPSWENEDWRFLNYVVTVNYIISAYFCVCICADNQRLSWIFWPTSSKPSSLILYSKFLSKFFLLSSFLHQFTLEFCKLILCCLLC